MAARTPRIVRISRAFGPTKVKAELHFNAKGELHRTDGPASVYTTVTTYSGFGDCVNTTTRKSWYREGQLHNEEGPARTIQVENTERSNLQCFANTHVTTNTQEWFVRGSRHRDEGPAVVTTNSEAADSMYRDDWGRKRYSTQTNIEERQYSFYVGGKLHREGAPAKVAHSIHTLKSYDPFELGSAPTFTPTVDVHVAHEFYQDGLPHPEHPTEVIFGSDTRGGTLYQGDSTGYGAFLKSAPAVVVYKEIVESENLRRYQELATTTNGANSSALEGFHLRQRWLDREGQLHRDQGPAVTSYTVTHNGGAAAPWPELIQSEEHYIHGKIGRQDGNQPVVTWWTHETLSCEGPTTRDTTYADCGSHRRTEAGFEIDREAETVRLTLKTLQNGELHNLFGPAKCTFQGIPASEFGKLADLPPKKLMEWCMSTGGVNTLYEWYVFGERCGRDHWEPRWSGRGEWPYEVQQARNDLARRAVRRWRRRVQQQPPANGLMTIDLTGRKLLMHFRNGRLENTDEIQCACACIVDGEETPRKQWSYENGYIRRAVKVVPVATAEAHVLTNYIRYDWWGRRHGCAWTKSSWAALDPLSQSELKFYIHGMKVTEEQYKHWASKWGDGRNNLFGLWPTMNKDRLLAALLRPFNSPDTRCGRTKLWRLYLDTLPEGADRPTYEEFIAATSA